MRTQLLNKIQKIVDEHSGATKEPSGGYRWELYTYYDDTVSDKQVKRICRSDDPGQSYEEWLQDRAETDGNAALSELLRQHLTPDEYDEATEDWLELEEALDISWFYSERSFLRNVKVNIMLDVGNGGYDFVCDNILNWDSQIYQQEGFEDGHFHERCSLAWLAKQQGQLDELERITSKIINGTLVDRNEEVSEDTLIGTILSEWENLPSHMATLTFLVSIPLPKLFQIQTMMKQDVNGYIVLGKQTMCGLFNPWTGSGSVLEVQLEKDVKIPIRDIWMCEMDGYWDYDVNAVYGLCGSAWKETVEDIEEEHK